jgi:hypothetical protein
MVSPPLLGQLQSNQERLLPLLESVDDGNCHYSLPDRRYLFSDLQLALALE